MWFRGPSYVQRQWTEGDAGRSPRACKTTGQKLSYFFNPRRTSQGVDALDVLLKGLAFGLPG
jgi:hypothetical protein